MGRFSRSGFDRSRNMKNVYFDCSSIGLIWDSYNKNSYHLCDTSYLGAFDSPDRLLSLSMQYVGEDKVLFGSDEPYGSWDRDVMIVERLNEILGDYDVIMLPASGDKAPLINSNSEKIEKLKDSYMILENHLIMGNFSGLPSLTLPLCMSDNMPIGINITGRAFDEQTVFNISSFIESKLSFKNMIAKESK
jgi:Asp-tRNA(Asn)/Glu-tRNA(Gln) amidotransferase A subunit family amidase